MFRGNKDKVMADVAEIVRRLRDTGVTLRKLQRQYQCSYATITAAILTQMDKAEYRQLCKKRLARGGFKTRFVKGRATWNKNLKGIHLSPATEFKKGNLPANHKSTGTINIRNDKCGKQFRWIKVNGVGSGRHRWIPYARWLWLLHKGKVPKGYFIVHVDGDTLNDSIENLRLVNRKEHLQLQMQRDPSMLVKMRQNSGRAAKKRHAANRLTKQRVTKQTVKQEIEKKFVSRRVRLFEQPDIVMWECSGCGYELPGDVIPIQCPKCNRGSFERIVVGQRLAV